MQQMKFSIPFSENCLNLCKHLKIAVFRENIDENVFLEYVNFFSNAVYTRAFAYNNS